MNFKTLLSILVLTAIFFSSPLLAQKESPATLTGKIIDGSDNTGLVGASVLLVGTYKGASTNIDGEFVVSGIKPGDYQIKIQYYGYETKIYNGYTFVAGETKTLTVTLNPQSESLNEVVIVGKESQINLEDARSEVSIKAEDIANMNARDVKEVLEMQAGVVKTQDGLQIRGARVYETEYIIDGISAQDPLAGTGFGVDVSSSSISNIDLITGGAGAEYGGGSSGVVNTQIKEGSKEFQISGSIQRDYLSNSDHATSFNTDRGEIALGFAIPLGKKELTVFTSGSMYLTDEYFGATANQLQSSLLPSNSELWAPRQTNSWTHTLKLGYKFKPGVKITFTNQHSVNINQNTRSLQIVGFDAILTPGFQYNRSLNLDNATTYTHHSNLSSLNFNWLINSQWGLNFSAGALVTNLRADANGRPFRDETVDQILDEQNITTYPVDIFNANSQFGVFFVLPGNGLVNNGGISSTWHDHYAEEFTFNAKATYVPSQVHEFKFGTQFKIKEYQWVDVSRPWVGAPIKINDTLTTPSISVGSSNDIWKVQPLEGGIYAQDKIVYKGIIATLGARLNYWAPGKFADDAVANPDAPVIDQIREDYNDKTFGLFGLNWKARLLPKINVSFPVTENNVLYFNYGHSMRLPHPRFMYAGLDPVYQDRSFLSSLGNPDLDPEVNVSYEIGLKSKVTKDLGITLTAYNNNRFDYIVSRSAIVKDQTGRPVTKTLFINQDYAKIYGVELGINYRIGEYFSSFSNFAYQVARGKSNSARESSLQIAQNGEISLTSEQFLAFDRPWNVNLGLIFIPDSTLAFFNINPSGFRAFLSYQFTSGFRYTPQVQTGANDLGRPQYQEQPDKYLQETADNWHRFDLKMSYNIPLGLKNGKGVSLSMEVRNLFDNQNSQIINPITGRAYEYGDDVPNTWRDPRPQYNGPQESGTDPRNPARYLAPRQVLFGLSFKF